MSTPYDTVPTVEELDRHDQITTPLPRTFSRRAWQAHADQYDPEGRRGVTLRVRDATTGALHVERETTHVELLVALNDAMAPILVRCGRAALRDEPFLLLWNARDLIQCDLETGSSLAAAPAARLLVDHALTGIGLAGEYPQGYVVTEWSRF